MDGEAAKAVVFGLLKENIRASVCLAISNMVVIIGKEGCPRCKELRALYPSVPYIEIPDVHIGLGDTICAITCFFGITPCGACRIRQHWCNKLFPYWWNNRKITSNQKEIKQLLLRLKAKQYPVIVDTESDKLVPIEKLSNVVEYINTK